MSIIGGSTVYTYLVLRDAGRHGCMCLYSLISSPISLAIEAVGSESSGLYVDVSARLELLSAIYIGGAVLDDDAATLIGFVNYKVSTLA